MCACLFMSVAKKFDTNCYAHWEQKGVPIRLEVGPKDLENGGCVLKRRVDSQKVFMKDCDSADFASQVKDQLNDIHDVMFKKASDDLNSHVRFASTWPEFIQALNDGCLVQAPFCGDKDVEADIKTRSAADTK